MKGRSVCVRSAVAVLALAASACRQEVPLPHKVLDTGGAESFGQRGKIAQFLPGTAFKKIELLNHCQFDYSPR